MSYLPFIPKGHFLQTQNSKLIILSFIIRKISWHFFLVSEENFTDIQTGVFLYVVHCFKPLFSLSYYDGFLWVHIAGVQSTSWICRSVSFAKFGKFSALISLNALSGHSLHSYWDSDTGNIGSLVLIPQLPEVLFKTLNLFSLSEFYCSVLMFSDSIFSQ